MREPPRQSKASQAGIVNVRSTPGSTRLWGGGIQAEQLDAAEVARIFEGQLESALLAEDGQLALSSLAASAAHGFMPRIQTQGQLGQARWRLVSAPSIPGASPRTPLCGSKKKKKKKKLRSSKIRNREACSGILLLLQYFFTVQGSYESHVGAPTCPSLPSPLGYGVRA